MLGNELQAQNVATVVTTPDQQLVLENKLTGFKFSNKLEMPENKPQLGWYVYCLSIMAAVGGFLFGYDTGVVSGVILYITEDNDLKTQTKKWQLSLIVAITPGMAAVSSVFAGKLSDMFGRRKLIIGSSVLFILGSVVCAIGVSFYIVLLGRINLGLAIGIASMIVPVYVSEASPSNIRGSLITGFQLMITFGLLMSSVMGGVFSYLDPARVGWRMMFLFAVVPAIVQLIGFLFMLPESPRYLYEKQRTDECKQVLEKIYNQNAEWVAYELTEIHFANKALRQVNAAEGEGNVLKRIAKTKHVRQALIIGCLLQVFQQLSGINTIMYYTSTIVRSSGIVDKHQTLWYASAVSAFNFFCTFIPLTMIERFGRRKMLFASMIGVIATLVLLSGGFLLINQDTMMVNNPIPKEWMWSRAQDGDSYCSDKYYQSNCDFCTTDHQCGFCTLVKENGKDLEKPDQTMSYCLPRGDSDTRSLFGPCSTNSSSNTHSGLWSRDNNTTQYEFFYSDTFCQTRFSFLPIVFIAIYLCFFAIGYAPIPWILNAEFYPLWARATSASIATFCNWTGNLIVSFTFLFLMESLTKFGVFLLYAACTAVGLIIFWKVVPETKDRNLDEIEFLFMNHEDKERLETEKFNKLTNVPNAAVVVG